MSTSGSPTLHPSQQASQHGLHYTSVPFLRAGIVLNCPVSPLWFAPNTDFSNLREVTSHGWRRGALTSFVPLPWLLVLRLPAKGSDTCRALQVFICAVITPPRSETIMLCSQRVFPIDYLCYVKLGVSAPWRGLQLRLQHPDMKEL